MRGGGRGGGGRQPYAAPDGADVAAIPPASMKMVQSRMGILADRSEAEIYATLCNCGMDPDIPVDRLISQDTFHEVRRNPDKKTETKSSQETRPRPFHKSLYPRYKAGSDRGGHFQAGVGGADSTSGAKGPSKKEAELYTSLNSAILDSVNTTRLISAYGNADKNEIPADSSFKTDGQNNTSHPPPQTQHGWDVPGRPLVDSVTSNAPNRGPKESSCNVTATKLPNGTSAGNLSNDVSSVDVMPMAEVSAVEESGIAPLAHMNLRGTSAPDGDEKEEDQIATASHLNNGLVMKTTNDSHYNEHSFEHNQNSNGDISTTMAPFDHLTLHEEESPKPSDDNAAVKIPGHLQVSGADCVHLTFGSFVSGTLDAPFAVKPLNNDGEVATVSDSQTVDHSDGSNMENVNDASVQQSEVPRTDFIDVTNNTEYGLSSMPNCTTSAVHPDSASHNYLQETRQLQNFSPLTSYMQGNIADGLTPPAIPPMREFDPAFSLLLANPPFAAMVHGTTSSSMSNTAVPTQPQEASPILVHVEERRPNFGFPRGGKHEAREIEALAENNEVHQQSISEAYTEAREALRKEEKPSRAKNWPPEVAEIFWKICMDKGGALPTKGDWNLNSVVDEMALELFNRTNKVYSNQQLFNKWNNMKHEKAKQEKGVDYQVCAEVNLAATSATKEARIQEAEAKLHHCEATCNRIAEEKKLLEKHNLMLEEQLSAKNIDLAESKKQNMDEQVRMTAKIAELERELSESSSSLRRSKERIFELEQRVSKIEKEADNLKQKLEKCEFDLENTRKSGELSLVPFSSVAPDSADLTDSTMQKSPARKRKRFNLKEDEKGKVSDCQEVSKKAYEQVCERARSLDEEMTKLRTELVSLRSERDKAVLEAEFARDRLNGSAAELEHQRKEANPVSLRNARIDAINY